MKVSSSDIQEIQWEKGILYVRFHSDRWFKYWPVSCKIWVKLLLAHYHKESVGKVFHKLVKGAGKRWERV